MRKLIAQRMNNRLAAPESLPRNQPPGGGLFVCGSGAPADEFGRPSVGVTRLCFMPLDCFTSLAIRNGRIGTTVVTATTPQLVLGQLAPSDCVREHGVEAWAVARRDQSDDILDAASAR
jgi:hypothetical protein